MPWEVGLRELAAGSVTPGRVHGLSRLTAPVHGARFWAALWAAAALAGFAALTPVLFDRGTPVPGYDVIHTVSGISFTAWGIVAWRRRPDSAIGRLLTATGFGVLVSPILESSAHRRPPRSPCSWASCGSPASPP